MRQIVSVVLILVLALSNAQKLSRYNIDTNQITISGISSGAAMSIQFHIAHSSLIKGAGAVAGVPFYCAMDSVLTATTVCVNQISLINVPLLITFTNNAAIIDSLDSVSNIKDSKVYLFNGKNDTVVNPAVASKIVEYYQYYGANIMTRGSNINAEHAWITNYFGNPCGYLGKPFINNCGFDTAKEMLNFFYPGLKDRTTSFTSNILKFEQSNYTPLSPEVISMNRYGFVYVPNGCKSGQQLCRLHVFLHGCEMSTDSPGNNYLEKSGLNEYAEANNIIIAYPQAAPSNILPYNPLGCWDWWGYTGADYACKLGYQVMAIRNIITALSGA